MIFLTKFNNCVGLFGTCGNSKWRDPVMEALKNAGIKSFNPVVDNWTPECAKIEAEHLATDRVILFVVTGETEGFGSLAETGWAYLGAIARGQKVFFVIEDFPDGNPKSDANRARVLVRAHMVKNSITVFATIEEATQVVIKFMKQEA